MVMIYTTETAVGQFVKKGRWIVKLQKNHPSGTDKNGYLD